jgi:uncharacterized protein (TIGR02145 family)
LNIRKYISFILLSVSIFISGCKKVEEMVVSTLSITGISENSADASGELINLGDGAIQFGHCYSTTSNPTIADSKTTLGVPVGTTVFTSHLKDLEAGAKYYIKAYLSNGTGTVYGNELSFITVAPSLPAVSTKAITSVTSTTAISGGNITGNGGAPITALGVCWGISPGPTVSDEKTSDGAGTDSFTSILNGLEVNTAYFVRAYATNIAGTSYGDEVNFVTTDKALSASTLEPTAVATTSVMLHGLVNAYNNTTDVTFEYGLTNGYGSSITAEESPANGVADHSVSAYVEGLVAYTTYHFRVKAVSVSGAEFGDDVSFTTTGTVTDIDGNVYNTVVIGTQLWMKENLKVTRYNDNSPIPLITVDVEWATIIGPGYCWYNNNESFYKETYGAMYKWHTIVSGTLCPTGWHVPSDAEWNSMINYLGGEALAGGDLKEAGTSHWSIPNTGVTNESGFTALPGGARTSLGAFRGIGEYGSWLTASEFDSELAWERVSRFDNSFVQKNTSKKINGLSVRCVEGKGLVLIYLPPVITNPVSNVTDNSAIIGGTVLTAGNASIVERGVCWSTDPGPTTVNNRTTEGTGAGSFVSHLSDLQPETAYYVRAYARNSAGTAYGNEISIMTLTVVPVAITYPVPDMFNLHL